MQREIDSTYLLMFTYSPDPWKASRLSSKFQCGFDGDLAKDKTRYTVNPVAPVILRSSSWVSADVYLHVRVND